MDFFFAIERHFAFLHDSNYRATSRKVCLGPGTEIQVTAKLFCRKIGQPCTHMCSLKHAAACRSTGIFSKGLHMLAYDRPDTLPQSDSPLPPLPRRRRAPQRQPEERSDLRPKAATSASHGRVRPSKGCGWGEAGVGRVPGVRGARGGLQGSKGAWLWGGGEGSSGLGGGDGQPREGRRDQSEGPRGIQELWGVSCDTRGVPEGRDGQSVRWLDRLIDGRTVGQADRHHPYPSG